MSCVHNKKSVLLEKAKSLGFLLTGCIALFVTQLVAAESFESNMQNVDNASQGVPFVRGQDLESRLKKYKANERITTTIRMKFAPAEQLVPLLLPLLSSEGHMQDYVPQNSIVIFDRVRNVTKITKIIKALDVPDKNKDDIEVVYLRYSSAAEVAKIIQALDLARAQKCTAEKFEVFADESTNSLVISGTGSASEQLKSIIMHLDSQKLNLGKMYKKRGK